MFRSTIKKLFLGMIVVSSGAAAEGPSDRLKEECSACHALSEVTLDAQARMAQKAPPLYYAGTKYRRDWMVSWLQNPARIRPGGMFSGNHTVVTDDGDDIDPITLQDHVKLSANNATEITDYLMTLTAKSDLIIAGEYKPKSVSKRMGEMNFIKFKGCGSCHQAEPDYGGVSGPELYTVFNRLKPDYIVSFIRDPIVWQGVSLMPSTGLNNREIYKLVDYLKLLSGEN